MVGVRSSPGAQHPRLWGAKERKGSECAEPDASGHPPDRGAVFMPLS